MIPKLFQLVALTAAALVQPLSAQSIGLNFGSGRANADLLVTDIAGAVPQGNWNNLAGGSGGPLVLNDSAAVVTAAEVTWATDEQWSLAAVPADANGRLLTGFISENNNASESTISVTGISYSLYNLYVYISHDRVMEDVILGEANGAFPDFTATENDPATDVAPVPLVQQVASGGTPGNYVVFTDLSGASFDLILSAVDAGGAGGGTLARNAIAGIQIVEVIPGDMDGDGLTDNWETLNGLDPNDNGLNPNNIGAVGNPDNGAAGDPDNDGSPNSLEQTQMTDPNDDDTDGDGLLDGVEDGAGTFVDATMTGTSPTMADTDGDTLMDGVEDNGGVVVDAETMTGTNPNIADTDGDSLRDDWEVANLLDPFDDGSAVVANGPAGDPDADGSDNAGEQGRGTDPQNPDSDADSLLDGVESDDGIYVDATATGTDPLDADTDGDFLNDGVEDNGGTFVDANQTGTDPNSADTDGDGLRDDFEIAGGGDPFDNGDVVLTQGAIALNFGAGRDNAALLATDQTGVFAQSNWNNLLGGSGGPFALVDELGAGSGASVTWAMDEQWSIPGPAVDPNGVMLTGWVSANGGAATNTIDITDIPYATYDLVVYFNHDRATEDVVISETNGAFADFVAEENDTDIAATVGFAQQVVSDADEPAENGNFAIFSELSESTLNLGFASGGGDRGAITGMQIINRGGADLAITDIALDAVAGEVTVTWNAVSGRSYAIDFAVNLAQDIGGVFDWQEIDDGIMAAAGADSASFTDTGVNFSTTPRRFYRVRELPVGQ